MTSSILADAGTHMDKTQQALQHEFGTVRTGRASASLLDKIHVDAYGSSMPLNQVANIKVPEPQSIIIEPWDKSVMGAIEKAIRNSDLGLNPSNDGQVIRVPFPPLTEERRKELVKLCKGYAEEARVAVRNVRREANHKLDKLGKEGEASEDDVRRAEAEVQKLTDSHVKEIDEALKRKEAEIMEV
ncbi:MAG: ribosome recycling factor [Actinobacteria bacterium HGW-Actinobacteria-7]|nr:MAG: ribosome recycling factor [Actinobacteria bacterium HGW-Actinobacteria-7]